MINRNYKDRLLNVLAEGKAVMLLGPRQVGKTTMLRAIAAERKEHTLFLDCDEPDVRALLTNVSSTELRTSFKSKNLIIIDEAQRIRDIGLTLKLITDKIKSVQLIISGSSALELSAEMNEPLTGRKVEIIMLGFSTSELIEHHGAIEEKRLLKHRLIYGMYPEIVTNPERAADQLTELTNGYMYKDIFNYQDIRRPELLPRLLEALAWQIGSEVSYNEVAQLVQSDPATVARYIDLLEKTMIVFRLSTYSRNLRNELKKSKKIYFYDNGIRNAIINDFRPYDIRTDRGALWENFMLSERFKYNMENKRRVKSYFWRTKQQQEIDLIEEGDGALSIFEFKSNPLSKVSFSKTFTRNYTVVSQLSIHPDNYLTFVTKT